MLSRTCNELSCCPKNSRNHRHFCLVNEDRRTFRIQARTSTGVSPSLLEANAPRERVRSISDAPRMSRQRRDR